MSQNGVKFSSSSESDQSQGMLVMPSVWAYPKVQGLAGSMGETPGCPISQAMKAGKHGSLILMIWQPKGAGTMRNI